MLSSKYKICQFITYLFCLVLVVLLGFAAKNLIRSKTGRSWMAIRDMDIAAEIIGVPPLKTKLSAFAISSFYIGVAYEKKGKVVFLFCVM